MSVYVPSSLGGSSTAMKYLSGFPYGPIGSASDANRPLNQITLAPMRIDRTVTINGFESRISGAGSAGALMRYGMYDGSSGQPRNLIIDAGTIDGSTTGLKTISVTPFTIPAGWYYLAAANQAVAIGAAPCIVIAQMLDGIPRHLNSNAGCGWTQAGVSGAFPATLGPFNTGGVTDTVYQLCFIAA